VLPPPGERGEKKPPKGSQRSGQPKRAPFGGENTPPWRILKRGGPLKDPWE